jgi:hypothetical protein
VLQSWFARSGIGGRDANLLSDAARRNLQHPFAYALARNVALAAMPARRGLARFLLCNNASMSGGSEIFL